ncbi:uncharacterized protein LOC144135491 [Amblyomma americanum]
MLLFDATKTKRETRIRGSKSTMPQLGEHVFYLTRLAAKLSAFLLMSVFISRHAESRWCFNAEKVDRSCVNKVKARLGLNGSEIGGFGGNLTVQDRVVLAGCFHELLRGVQPECIDVNFLSDFYACVFDYSSGAKEKMKAMKTDSRDSAWKLGQQFTECLNRRLIPWTEDFWVKNTAVEDPVLFSFLRDVDEDASTDAPP